MKKFRLAVLAAVVCTAALLTSCIKEESYEVSTAYLDVTFTTRAGESQVQGDKIEDVMVWAFQCTGVDANGMPTGIADDAKAAGWRKQTGLNTYQSVNLHVELPMCGDGGQDYVLVAIVNNGKFGTISPALDETTQWAQLKAAIFNASNQDYWAKHIGNVKGDDPDAMPVSHWTTFRVSKDNTHTTNPNTNDYNCAKVTMPVYRAVAKASLSMVKASNFDLTVTDAKLVSAAMPTNGLVLSSLSSKNLENADDLNDDNPTPTWFDSKNLTYAESKQERYLMRAEDDAQISGTNTVSVTAVKPAEGTTAYGFVGSAVIYETDEACTQSGTTFAEGTVSGDGYYLSVSYKIGDTSFTKNVAIPYAVVRNHDYQIKATVKSDGGVVVNYTVADWEEVEWNLEFDAAQNSELLPSPNDNDTPKPTAPAEVSYTQGTEEGAAVFFFKMDGPDGITWKPAILNASKDHYITRVYEVIPKTTDTGGNILTYELSNTPIEGDIVAEPDKFYCIKVIALNADAHSARTEPIELGVTHAPQWNEEKSNLLVVNPKDTYGSYFWPGKDANGNATNTIGDELRVYIYPKH